MEPSAATISDGTYPLSRSLYLYVNTDKVATNSTLAAFVDSYLSDQGIAAVTDADYMAIPAERLAATRQAWAQAEGCSERETVGRRRRPWMLTAADLRGVGPPVGEAIRRLRRRAGVSVVTR